MAELSTRDHIIEAADLLFYRHGFDHTSFADIAAAVEISRGNFYYHFKAKDQILEEVIHLRLARTRAMLAQWEADGATPLERIKQFIDIQIVNRKKIRQHGCPIGTLCNELAKLEHDLHGASAALFTLLRDWLGGQFEELGAGDDADKLAMHLLARNQGIATLANAIHDDEFVNQEVQQLHDWLNSQKRKMEK